MNDKHIYEFYKIADEMCGYGYGTGEYVIVPLIKKFLTLCKANDYKYDHSEIEKKLGQAITWFLINGLCKLDVIEYGTSPRFAWISGDKEDLVHAIVKSSDDELYKIATMDFDESERLKDSMTLKVK